MPNVVNWLAASALAALLGVAAGTLLRADEAAGSPLAAGDSIVRALGAPSGVLAVVNPVNCALSAEDAAALNAVAAVPGLRVTVLLLAVPAHDSVMRAVRRDFEFVPQVAVRSAATVDARQLPEMFRMPFVAVVVRGQLRHAAWGDALKSLSAWLPRVAAGP